MRSLLEFFEQHVVPQFATRTKWWRNNQQFAVYAFGKFLKREPMLDDLTPENFAAFKKWLRSNQRYARSTARSHYGAIHGLWRAAHAAGLAVEPTRRWMREKPWAGRIRHVRKFRPVAPVDQEPPSGDSLVTLLDRYRIERDVSERAISQCAYSVQKLTQFLGRPAVLSDFTDTTLNEFLFALQQSTPKLSPLSIKGTRTNLLTLWRLAFEAELLDHQPRRVRKIKVPRTMPVAWTLDELRRLHDAAAAVPGRFQPSGVRRARYYVAFVACGFFTALRLGDLLGLRFDQIEKTGWITILQAKTGWPIRCYLPPDAMRAIEQISRPRRPRVFSIISQRAMQKRFKGIVERAGLTGSIKTLRKTAATLAECQMPGSASWLLGHRDSSLARRNYIDVRQVQGAKPMLPPISIQPEANGSQS